MMLRPHYRVAWLYLQAVDAKNKRLIAFGSNSISIRAYVDRLTTQEIAGSMMAMRCGKVRPRSVMHNAEFAGKVRSMPRRKFCKSSMQPFCTRRQQLEANDYHNKFLTLE